VTPQQPTEQQEQEELSNLHILAGRRREQQALFHEQTRKNQDTLDQQEIALIFLAHQKAEAADALASATSNRFSALEKAVDRTEDLRKRAAREAYTDRQAISQLATKADELASSIAEIKDKFFRHDHQAAPDRAASSAGHADLGLGGLTRKLETMENDISTIFSILGQYKDKLKGKDDKPQQQQTTETQQQRLEEVMAENRRLTEQVAGWDTKQQDTLAQRDTALAQQLAEIRSRLDSLESVNKGGDETGANTSEGNESDYYDGQGCMMKRNNVGKRDRRSLRRARAGKARR
jgi:Mg2+ and Co2+ transporter CorA